MFLRVLPPWLPFPSWLHFSFFVTFVSAMGPPPLASCSSLRLLFLRRPLSCGSGVLLFLAVSCISRWTELREQGFWAFAIFVLYPPRPELCLVCRRLLVVEFLLLKRVKRSSNSVKYAAQSSWDTTALETWQFQ